MKCQSESFNPSYMEIVSSWMTISIGKQQINGLSSGTFEVEADKMSEMAL